MSALSHSMPQGLNYSRGQDIPDKLMWNSVIQENFNSHISAAGVLSLGEDGALGYNSMKFWGFSNLS